jgi:hypothetical protein
MALKLTEWGYAPRKIFAVGRDLMIPARDVSDGLPGPDPSLLPSKSMQYNVAVVVRAADDLGNEFDVVLDPLAGNRAQTVDQWLYGMRISSDSYRQFDISRLDGPGRAAADEMIGDFFFGTIQKKLYDNRPLVYTADPETYHPFAAAEYLGQKQDMQDGRPYPLKTLQQDYPADGDQAKDPRERAIDVARLRQDYPFRERTPRDTADPSPRPASARPQPTADHATGYAGTHRATED